MATGWITKRGQTTGHGLGSGSKVGRRKYPLRKIIGTIFWKEPNAKEWQHEHEYELLECGHLGELCASVGTNLFGAQIANGRRCLECFKELDAPVLAVEPSGNKNSNDK